MTANKRAGKRVLGRLSDEELERLPVGNAPHHAAEMAMDAAEAAELIAHALMAMGRGDALTKRQFGLVAYLLDPVTFGRHPNPLPFKVKEGRKPAQKLTGLIQAYEVEALRTSGSSLEAAIARVAGDPENENAVRGHYQRTSRAQLIAMRKSSLRLRAYQRLLLRTETS